MKKMMMMSVLLFNIVAFAKESGPFTVTERMTKYYYAVNPSEAAQAMVWDYALKTCDAQRALPILIKPMVLRESMHEGIATGTFRCVRIGDR